MDGGDFETKTDHVLAEDPDEHAATTGRDVGRRGHTG